MKRIIVFGASGFIGGHLVRRAVEEGFQVHGFSRSGDDVRFSRIDIANSQEVANVIAENHPDIVFNVAAISNIDEAEIGRERAWSVNVNGARNIAKACAASHCRHVFFSSDAVFSGEDRAYVETDPPAPVNYYGLTKMEAEKAVVEELSTAVIVRVSLVLGFPLGGGRSFISEFDRRLKHGESLAMSVEEMRTPIDVQTLVSCCLELACGDFKGIYHLGTTNAMSRFDIGRLYALKAGYDENLVSCASGRPKGQVQRHRYGVLNCEKARRGLSTPLLCVDESLDRILEMREKK